MQSVRPESFSGLLLPDCRHSEEQREAQEQDGQNDLSRHQPPSGEVRPGVEHELQDEADAPENGNESAQSAGQARSIRQRLRKRHAQ